MYSPYNNLSLTITVYNVTLEERRDEGLALVVVFFLIVPLTTLIVMILTLIAAMLLFARDTARRVWERIRGVRRVFWFNNLQHGPPIFHVPAGLPAMPGFEDIELNDMAPGNIQREVNGPEPEEPERAEPAEAEVEANPIYEEIGGREEPSGVQPITSKDSIVNEKAHWNMYGHHSTYYPPTPIELYGCILPARPLDMVEETSDEDV